MDKKFVVFDFGILSLEWPTLLFGIVVFLIVLFFFNLWLFRPILANLQMRKKFVEGLEKENDKKEKQVEESIQKIQQERKNHLERLDFSRLQKQKEIQKEIGEFLENARLEFRTEQGKYQAKVNSELLAVKNAVPEELKGLKDALFKKVGL